MTSTYCRVHGVGRWICGCTMSCDEARAIRLRLTGQTPHTPTPAELRELAEPDAPSGTRTRAAERRSDADAGTGTSDTREAGRSAHSKPKVVRGLAGWFYHCHACRRGTCHDTQPEAFAAALEHVREVHEPKTVADLRLRNPWFPGDDGTPKPALELLGFDPAVADRMRAKWAADRDHHEPKSPADISELVGLGVWPKPLADQIDPAQVMWADAFDRAHNNPGGRS